MKEGLHERDVDVTAREYDDNMLIIHVYTLFCEGGGVVGKGGGGRGLMTKPFLHHNIII